MGSFPLVSVLDSIDQFGVLILDSEGTIVELNRMARHILHGCNRVDATAPFQGTNWECFFCESDRVSGLPQQILTHAKTVSFPMTVKVSVARERLIANFPCGETPIECSVRPIIESGVVVGFSCLIEKRSCKGDWDDGRSLLEQGLLEEGMPQNEPILKELAGNVDGVFWVYDFGLESFTYVSPSYQKVFGVSSRSRGSTIEDWAAVVHREDRERYKAAFDKQRNGEGTVEEYRIACMEESLRWVVDRAFPVVCSSGQVTRVVGVIRDISDRILSKERIAVQRAEMLHVSRLSALGLMSAALSHELNQPLSAIANYASACEAVLRMHANSGLGSVQDFIRRIIEQSLRAGEIVRRLRDFSRKSPTRLSTTNVNNILLDTSRLMTVDLRWRGIRLQWELNDDLPDIQGDTIQLQQVFVNLFTNAADALQSLESSQRIITIRTQFDSSHVIVEIEDRGIGIRADVLPRLFEPFVSTKVDGSGIGLSICQTILETHGGDIQASNSEPNGSKFVVRIPYSRTATKKL